MSEQAEHFAGAPEKEPTDELVTVAEAAARLGADESALRRLLKRSPNAEKLEGRTGVRTRVTQTGTRNATVYPWLLVEEIVRQSRPEVPKDDPFPSKTAPEETPAEEMPNAGQETDATQSERGSNEGNTDAGNGSNAGNTGSSVFSLDEPTRAYLSLLTQQMQGRIDDLSKNVADLRGERDRLLEENAKLKAVAASVPTEQIQNQPLERTGDPQASDSVSGGQVEAPATQEAVQTPRPWWQFWNR